jgi:hypothetical protein
MKKIKEILISFFLILSFACAYAEPARNFTHLGIALQDQNQQLPNGFNNYILFISPSHTYVEKSSQEKLNNLGKAFLNFKKYIGQNNLAVWCGSINKNKFNFNVSLSKYYADRFGLNYNDGPYIIITNVNPSHEDRNTEKPYYISFSSINPERIIVILNDVEQQLRTQQTINQRELYLSEKKQFIYSNADAAKTFVNDIVNLIKALKK